jgi:hypothetical protein
MDIEPEDNLWGFKTIDNLSEPKSPEPSEVEHKDQNQFFDLKLNRYPPHQICYKGEKYEYWKGTYYK